MMTGVRGWRRHMRSSSGRSGGDIRKLRARRWSAAAWNILSYPSWSSQRGPSPRRGRVLLPRMRKARMPRRARSTMVLSGRARLTSVTAGTIPVPT